MKKPHKESTALMGATDRGKYKNRITLAEKRAKAYRTELVAVKKLVPICRKVLESQHDERKLRTALKELDRAMRALHNKGAAKRPTPVPMEPAPAPVWGGESLWEKL